MRKLTAGLLMLCLLCSAALAEITCICGNEACLCFIQLGDEGLAVEAIQEALKAQGYLAGNDDASVFDEKTQQATLAFQEANGLSPTGMMDDDTLTLLLWGLLPEALDQAEPAALGGAVWIPTDGGIKHHKRGSCCKMLDPRLVSQRNALLMGMEPCGRCKPDGFNTELTYFSTGR